MAKTKTYQPKGPKSIKKSVKPDDKWTQDMLDRAQDALTFDSEQRRRCVEDMKFAFVSGHQWDTHLTAKRRNKPNYEFNRVRQLIRRVTGQQLSNKPEIKCRATDDANVDTADILNGMIKTIETQSSADNAYDTAFQWSCGGGYGILRVKSDYESPDTFDQCLRIEAVLDPMTCYCDPAAVKFDRSDARYWFITDTIPTAQFKEQWPNAQVIDFDVTGADDEEWARLWVTEEMTRIAEYWYIEKQPKTIHLLSDGSVVDAADWDEYQQEFANPPPAPPIAAPPPDPNAPRGTPPPPSPPSFAPVTIKSTREVEVDVVYSCPVSGYGQLEKPTKWGGSMIPIVPQWGDLISINGKQIYSGMTRFARDAQTIHNFEMSSMVEVVAKLPNTPLMATPAMIKGFESYYERLGYDDPPVLLHNADPAMPGSSPVRQPMSQLPTSLANLSNITVDEMKATTGVYDASVGSSGNETSGRAIMARNAQAETANFVYVDNQVKALKRLGDILVDAIPIYYDAERTMRIIGPDLSAKYVTINKMVTGPDGTEYVENDLSKGKYDVVVTVGKSYDTQRMELAAFAQTLAATPGPVGAIGQYLMIKTMDVPGIDEAVQWVRSALVKQGIIPPGPNDPPPPGPPPPSPIELAQVAHHQGQATLAQARAQDIQAKTATQVQLEEAKAASLVASIPGTEAEGHQTMIQNGAALAPQFMPQQPVGFAVPHEGPIGPSQSDAYTGGF